MDATHRETPLQAGGSVGSPVERALAADGSGTRGASLGSPHPRHGESRASDESHRSDHGHSHDKSCRSDQSRMSHQSFRTDQDRSSSGSHGSEQNRASGRSCGSDGSPRSGEGRVSAEGGAGGESHARSQGRVSASGEDAAAAPAVARAIPAHLDEPAAGPAPHHRELLRRRLGFAAVIACLPYLGLKLLWICGSDVGVVDHDKTATGGWIAANMVTFLMDAVAALIAYLLTRPGGPRIRAWLIAVPMWIATGLLSVIMLAVPLNLVGVLFGAPNPFARDGFLDPWVYGVVYGGFIVEGIVLLGAFTMYAHDRLGSAATAPIRVFTRLLPSAVRTAAVVAAGLLAAAAVVRLAWACGAEFGLTADRLDELDGTARLVQAVQAALALAAAAGLALLARGRSTARGRIPLAAAWTGSAAAFGWGGFIGITGALARVDHRPSAFMIAVYIAEALAGFLVVGAGWRGLAAVDRGRQARQPGIPTRRP